MDGALRLGVITSHPWVATIGNFDGFHLGHQLLFDKLKTSARQYGAKSAVFSFSPHPRLVLRPDLDSEFIYSESEKITLFKKSEIDIVFMINFTKDFSQLTVDKFFAKQLTSFHCLKKLIVGADFCFGHNRQGTTPILARLCSSMKIAFESVPLLKKEKVVISSSAIRKMLKNGDFISAAKSMGRIWSISGKVISGQQLGQKIGIATANVELDRKLPLERGVYACLVKYQGQLLKGAANYGIRPTIGGDQLSFEVHLLDCQQDIYHKPLEVLVIKKLRPEKKFTSLTRLTAAINSDIDKTNKNVVSWYEQFPPYLRVINYAHSC